MGKGEGLSMVKLQQNPSGTRDGGQLRCPLLGRGTIAELQKPPRPYNF